MHRLIEVIGLFFVVAACPAAAGDRSEEWGGGRMFFQGWEIMPPVEFAGFGGPILFADGIRVDPLPCDFDPEPEWGRDWCGTNEDDAWRHRLAQQELAVERLLALSSLPLVMIGCDYFYRPDADQAERVLNALDAGDLEAMVKAGAPAEVARDLRLAGP